MGYTGFNIVTLTVNNTGPQLKKLFLFQKILTYNILKETFDKFSYNPKLPIKQFFNKFKILNKLYDIPELLILLNNFGKTKDNIYLLKESLK